jgi:hypothetical protein
METGNYYGDQDETGAVKVMKREVPMSSRLHFFAIGIKDNEYDCPFGNPETSICSASLSSMFIEVRRRQTYCKGDDYDSCPIFLARMLRRAD